MCRRTHVHVNTFAMYTFSNYDWRMRACMRHHPHVSLCPWEKNIEDASFLHAQCYYKYVQLRRQQRPLLL